MYSRPFGNVPPTGIYSATPYPAGPAYAPYNGAPFPVGYPAYYAPAALPIRGTPLPRAPLSTPLPMWPTYGTTLVSPPVQSLPPAFSWPRSYGGLPTPFSFAPQPLFGGGVLPPPAFGGYVIPASTAKRVILVVGATGTQGGGLVRAILADPASPFTVRAVTRNATSEKAEALRKAGCEVVAADLEDEASLVLALQGVYGAFLVTDFWQGLTPEQETQQAHNFAKAAKAAGVQHVVFSTLEDSRDFIPLSDERMPTLKGKYKVPHLDAKGEANKFFIQLGVPTTFLYTSMYWENFINFSMGPKRGPDGKLAITFPMDNKKIAGIATEDIGRCAYGIFKRGPQLIGMHIGIAGELPTGAEMAAAFTKALGQEVVYNAVPPEVYRSFRFPGADDIGNMFQFERDFETQFCSKRSVGFSRELNPQLQSFEQWLAANKSRISIPE